jgi:Formyl transferase, C-terminal domain
LPECPWVIAAPLAGSRACAAGDFGWRCHHRRHGHADGGGAGYWARPRDDGNRNRAPDDGPAYYGAGGAWRGADGPGFGRFGGISLRGAAGKGVTYAAKIDKAETKLDFSLSAAAVERQIRAFNPTPGAWFEFDGERYRVLAADIVAAHGATGEIIDDQLTIACGVHAIRPTRIQRAGKPAMPTADLLRGKAIPVGTALS